MNMYKLFSGSISLVNCIIIIVVASLSTACSSSGKGVGVGATEQSIYNEARRLLEKNRYDLAIIQLEALEREFPFGPYAEQAQIELIYAHYKSANYEAAIERAERFITQHPEHPQQDFVYYMMGISTYSASYGFITRFFNIDRSTRDQTGAKQALTIFRKMIDLYPQSAYASDVIARMTFLRNLLARQEVTIANSYLKQKAWLSAANRSAYVIRHFQQTPAVADAIAVMIFAYRKLGIDDLADDGVRVLAMNFPDYPSFDKNGNFSGPSSPQSSRLISRLTLGAIPPPSLTFDTRHLNN